MKAPMEFVAAIARIWQDVFGPLVGFGKQDAVGVLLVDVGAHLFKVIVGFG